MGNDFLKFHIKEVRNVLEMENVNVDSATVEKVRFIMLCMGNGNVAKIIKVN